VIDRQLARGIRALTHAGSGRASEEGV
jgi:hypothetical protein